MESAGSKLSKNTSRAYARDMADFLRFIGGARALPGLTRRDVEAYRDHLAESTGYRPATVNRKLCAVRHLLGEATRSGIFKANPAARVKGFGRASTHSPAEALSARQVQHLLSTIDRISLIGKRDYALLSLMIRAGVRRSEITMLYISDLCRLERRAFLSVMGRQNRVRCVELPRDVQRAIDAWLIAANMTDPDAPMFAETRKTSKGSRTHYKVRTDSPLSTDGIWYIVRRRVNEAGITANITPQSLRRTFVTLAKGAPTPAEEEENTPAYIDFGTMQPLAAERQAALRDTPGLAISEHR